MTTLLPSILRLLAPPAQGRADPARQLMERAGARAGRNPFQAQELRQAAFALLRLVR